MLNIDKVIDDFNENELPKKIEEAQSNYYQVINDGSSNVISNGEITASSFTTLKSDDIYSIDFQQMNNCIKEQDQVRHIKIHKEDLLKALESEEDIIDLKVFIEGRECNNIGNAINDDF